MEGGRSSSIYFLLSSSPPPSSISLLCIYFLLRFSISIYLFLPSPCSSCRSPFSISLACLSPVPFSLFCLSASFRLPPFRLPPPPLLPHSPSAYIFIKAKNKRLKYWDVDEYVCGRVSLPAVGSIKAHFSGLRKVPWKGHWLWLELFTWRHWGR